MVATLRHPRLTFEKQASSPLARKQRMLVLASTGSNAKLLSSVIVLGLHGVYIVSS
jgi:hypothetical protein